MDEIPVNIKEFLKSCSNLILNVRKEYRGEQFNIHFEFHKETKKWNVKICKILANNTEMELTQRYVSMDNLDNFNTSKMLLEVHG